MRDTVKKVLPTTNKIAKSIIKNINFRYKYQKKTLYINKYIYIFLQTLEMFIIFVMKTHL